MIGPVFDIFGRKWPLIIAYFIASISIGVMPLFNTVYPSLLILKILAGCGLDLGP